MASYSFTDSPQIVTIATTGEYEIMAYGAQGGAAGVSGHSDYSAGGAGAEVQGDFNLTAGEHLEIVVGGEGAVGIAGAYASGGGGGGGTFILANTGPGGSYQLLEVAGGGGGGGGGGAHYAGLGGAALGSAGGGGGGYGPLLGGGGGTGVNSYGGSAYLGAGGGVNGHDTSSPYAGGGAGNAGGFGGGGAGSPFDSGGGGGGGGYSGGEGGNGGVPQAGGGTSWVSTTALGASSVGSEHTGDGEVVLTPVCFCSGTLIRTARGEVAVEDLRVGDLAVTATGQARPIVWIGVKRVERPNREQRPVRVMVSAFGENLPTRDLWLSPGHAVCLNVIEEVFVPVGELVNGATIVHVEVDEVTYWHVELESHDVLLAEGMPCESYMDAGNRAFFGREYGRLESLDPERIEASLAAYARPFVNDPASLESVRRRLTARAERRGWARTSDQDLHLMVDGERLEPMIEAGVASFAFPARARTVRICSRTFSPAWTGEGQDRRELGVCLRRLQLGDGRSPGREVPLDDLAGFHPEEAKDGHAWRWTEGALELPGRLWSACNDIVVLSLACDLTAGWTWLTPEAAAPDNILRLAKIA